MPINRIRRAMLFPIIVAPLAIASGCGGPNKANIELRKNEQTLQSRIDSLQRGHAADEATIRGLQSNATTVPSLSQDRLDQLFTVAGLKIGRLTGGYHPDPSQSADTMLKVYAVPTDQQGDEIKAAGTFKIELFDLAQKGDNSIGTWDFDINAAKAAWISGSLLYTYVLDCPWQKPPTHAKLTARITFTDALTGRVFSVDREVNVIPPK